MSPPIPRHNLVISLYHPSSERRIPFYFWIQKTPLSDEKDAFFISTFKDQTRQQ